MIKEIKNILNPDKFAIEPILSKLREHNITFTEITEAEQSFEDIFSGRTKTGDMILVVSAHSLHDHEKDKDENPEKDWYFMCSIVIPRPPHLVLPFSSTNENCWLGKCAPKRTGVRKRINQKTS